MWRQCGWTWRPFCSHWPWQQYQGETEAMRKLLFRSSGRCSAQVYGNVFTSNEEGADERAISAHGHVKCRAMHIWWIKIEKTKHSEQFQSLMIIILFCELQSKWMYARDVYWCSRIRSHVRKHDRICATTAVFFLFWEYHRLHWALLSSTMLHRPQCVFPAGHMNTCQAGNLKTFLDALLRESHELWVPSWNGMAGMSLFQPNRSTTHDMEMIPFYINFVSASIRIANTIIHIILSLTHTHTPSSSLNQRMLFDWSTLQTKRKTKYYTLQIHLRSIHASWWR